MIDALVLAELARAPQTRWRFSAAYRALRRLERDGLVTSAPLRGTKRGRRLYRLTQAGAEALAVARLVSGS
jgi:DNA-binding PadR family transcriptional regulator